MSQETDADLGNLPQIGIVTRYKGFVNGKHPLKNPPLIALPFALTSYWPSVFLHCPGKDPLPLLASLFNPGCVKVKPIRTVW